MSLKILREPILRSHSTKSTTGMKFMKPACMSYHIVPSGLFLWGVQPPVFFSGVVSGGTTTHFFQVVVPPGIQPPIFIVIFGWFNLPYRHQNTLRQHITQITMLLINVYS